MDLKLKEKSVVVLAAGSGIGKGVALEFAKEKAKIMLLDISEEKLKLTQNEIFQETGVRPIYSKVDLRNVEEIGQAIDQATSENGPIFALFNNTGGPPPGTFEKFEDQDWYDAFELTLLCYVRTIRYVLPIMKASGGGRIVCNTSSSIKQVLDNLILSNVFRTGIMGLAKSLARELAQDNILINVVGPGKIDTDRVKQIDSIKAQKQGISLEEFQKQNANLIPRKRYGTSSEMGKLVTFLCSGANTYITGQNILVDGGMTTAY